LVVCYCWFYVIGLLLYCCCIDVLKYIGGAIFGALVVVVRSWFRGGRWWGWLGGWGWFRSVRFRAIWGRFAVGVGWLVVSGGFVRLWGACVNRARRSRVGWVGGSVGVVVVGRRRGWSFVALVYVRRLLSRRRGWSVGAGGWGRCQMKGGGGVSCRPHRVVQTLYFRKKEKTKKSILRRFNGFKILWWYSCSFSG